MRRKNIGGYFDPKKYCVDPFPLKIKSLYSFNKVKYKNRNVHQNQINQPTDNGSIVKCTISFR